MVDNDTYSGRRLWHTFYLSNGFDQKALRKVADATAVTQAPGETFEQWCSAVTSSQPEIKVKINIQPDIDRATGQPKVDEATGKEVKRNVIDFKNVFLAN